jgi:hypothetical protein
VFDKAAEDVAVDAPDREVGVQREACVLHQTTFCMWVIVLAGGRGYLSEPSDSPPCQYF